ncbi:MAG TPA: aminoglycoside phosphotransferase family protein [Jiangellales bacterium]|nr:aminoglycoside phosphotransferase family protein [Jiangellales bacterium]
MIVPKDFLDSARRTFGPPGSRWCARLPDIVAEYVEAWHLEIDLRDDEECWFGMCGIVVPVRPADGEPAVLKVSWVDRETEHEHTALAAWRGNGAVRLLAADGPRGVILMERLDRNRSLRHEPIDQAVDILARLLRRLAIPAPGEIETVQDLAARWVDELPRRWAAASPAAPRRLLEAALDAARGLGPESGRLLVHTDLHFENVLAARLDASAARGRWLAIDPKPMAGDLEFGALPTLWNRLDDLDTADQRAALLCRTARFSEAAGLDIDRVRAWSVARAVETVIWNAEIGMTQENHRPAWVAETLARIS